MSKNEVYLNPERIKKISQYSNSLLMWFGMWWRLPSASFWGLKVKKIDLEVCEVMVPYNWRTKNPFRSIYFSALAGAAELSTGALMICHLAGAGRWSMLVRQFKMEYVKKATTDIVFFCKKGDMIKEAINNGNKSGEPQELVFEISGINTEGELVATATIVWSIKKK